MLANTIDFIKPIRYMKTCFVGTAVLETGVVIHMRSDGSALGDDGKTYYTVSRNDENGECEVLGYSSDIDAPVDDVRE